MYLSVYLFVYVSIYLSDYISIYLSVYISIYLSGYVSIYLYVCIYLLSVQDAIKRMESTLNRAQSDIQKFKQLTDEANALVVERQEQEQSWENVPEEFEDAVMGEMMDDPVVLPTSGKVMDRRHIIR